MWINTKLGISTPFLIVIFSLFPRIDAGSITTHLGRKFLTSLAEYGSTVTTDLGIRLFAVQVVGWRTCVAAKSSLRTYSYEACWLNVTGFL